LKESVIQKSILDLLTWKSKNENIYFFRAGAGSMKMANGRHFKTGRPGCPDIVVCSKGGKFIGLEVKTATGRPSQSQKVAEQEIEGAGGEYHIVRSVGDVKEIFGW